MQPTDAIRFPSWKTMREKTLSIPIPMPGGWVGVFDRQDPYHLKVIEWNEPRAPQGFVRGAILSFEGKRVRVPLSVLWQVNSQLGEMPVENLDHTRWSIQWAMRCDGSLAPSRWTVTRVLSQADVDESFQRAKQTDVVTITQPRFYIGYKVFQRAKQTDVVTITQPRFYIGYKVFHGKSANPCGEVQLAPAETCKLPGPPPAICQCDIKDLMTFGHVTGCPEKKR